MSGPWPSIHLGDVVDIFDSVRIPLSGAERRKRQGPYPYYGASGVIDSIDDYLFDGRYLLIAEDGENLNSRKLPVAFLAEGKFWVNNHAHIVRGRRGAADDVYLQGWFAQAEIGGYVTGAAQPKLTQANLRRLPISLPPLPTQRKIATILSAYDDLIDNNNRRIRVLEEMAQRIYRHWFVDLRYPGHGDATFEDSKLGPIPQGWKVQRLAELVTPQYGYTESTSVEPVGPRFLRGMDMNKSSFIDWSYVPYCPITATDRVKYALQVGDVLVIRMADPGKVGIVERPVDAVFASYLIRLRPINELLRPYSLFYFLSSDRYQDFVSGASTGTTRRSLSAPGITSIDLAVPPINVQELFEQQIVPLRLLLSSFLVSNSRLRSARDLLLPRLMSGEINVEDLDIEVPEVAA